MGLLRLFLAITVFISHFGNIEKFNTLISGELAVRVFYVISGFYIQLIISQYEHQKHWKRNFYLSRIFRLFPTYYLILILTMIWSGTSCNRYCINMVINDSLSSLAIYYVTNFFIVGQSIVRFLTYHYNTGSFSFDPNITRPSYWLSNMEIVGQAWSLAIELYFYCMAPFILKRRSSTLIIIALCSFAIKIFLAMHGYDNSNTWYNAFFPAEIHTFLLGALAARIAMDSSRLNPLKKYLAVSGIFYFIAWNYKQIAFIAEPDELLILSVFCFLPFVYAATCNSYIDRWIGELSYPVYLNHLLVIAFLGQYITNPHLYLLSSIALSIVMGICMILLIEHPIARFRHRKFRTTSTLSGDLAPTVTSVPAELQPLLNIVSSSTVKPFL